MEYPPRPTPLEISAQQPRALSTLDLDSPTSSSSYEAPPPPVPPETLTTAEYLHNCAPFIAKLYSLVNAPEYASLIGWSDQYNGRAFCIKDALLFSQEVLPKHFKHGNMSSFIRQLNIYGFHKVESKTGTCYRHDDFLYNHPEYLDRIKRKKNRKSTSLFTDTPKAEEPAAICVYTLQIDLSRIKKTVADIHAEVLASKTKWNDLGRRIDSLDGLFTSFFNSVPTYSPAVPVLQNPPLGFQQQGYPAFCQPPRRIPEYPLEQERRRDQPQ